MLERIDLPSSIDQRPIPARLDQLICLAERRIEAFQDRWDRVPIEQFVAADYRLVYQTLDWTLSNQLLIGRRFLEWGCGFAIVSCLASSLELDAVGMEAEAELLAQAERTRQRCEHDFELVHGNFLPPGSERLATDSSLPSLGHGGVCGYESLGLDLNDFAIVYSYPWPGEDEFHECVFDRFAAVGAILMLFIGPNDIRLWRKKR